MNFAADASTSIGMQSLFEYYERIFWRWTDTHAHLEKEDFFNAVRRTFRNVKTVEVCDNHDVFVGVCVPDKLKPAKEVLARQQKRDLRRLQRAGKIDPPKTAFAQKLLEDPLLMRPRSSKNSTPMSGSFIARTRRRGGGPDGERGERQPHGDEEPGFPGLSMKRQQVRYKSELEKQAKEMKARQKELDEQAGLPVPPPPGTFPPRGGITYVD